MNKLALAAVLVKSAIASAGPKEQSKELVAKAQTAFASGRYEDALTDLQAAYKLTPQPDLIYAIGQANSKLGRCDDARLAFETFRKTSKDPAVAKIVEEAIAACKPKAAEAATEPTPPPAQPDNEPPPIVDTPPPAHEPQPPPPPTTTTTTTATASPPVEPPPEVHATAPRRVWYKNPLADGLIVGGVVAGVVGLVVYNSATSDLDQAEKAPTLAGYNQLVNSAHGERTDAVVLGVASGAAIIGGVVFMLRGRGESAPPPVAVTPTRAGGVVTWQTRF